MQRDQKTVPERRAVVARIEVFKAQRRAVSTKSNIGGRNAFTVDAVRALAESRVGVHSISVLKTIRPPVALAGFNDVHRIVRLEVAKMVSAHVGHKQPALDPFHSNGVPQPTTKDSLVLAVEIHLENRRSDRLRLFARITTAADRDVQFPGADSDC